MALSGDISRISLIGAGNVAWHLGKGFKDIGLVISEVWSRHPETAAELAKYTGASAIQEIESIKQDVDLIIVALSDDALPQIAKKIRLDKVIVVHTSGSVPMDVLSGTSENYGVLYPLQTFSKQVPLDLAKVPFCIEASDPLTYGRIQGLASKLSENIRHITSSERLLIHTAAVIASNYSNFMYLVAKDILSSKKLDFELLEPLISETTRKALHNGPYDAMTGPARRGDNRIIDKHLELLASIPEYAEIYRLLAKAIQNRFK